MQTKNINIEQRPAVNKEQDTLKMQVTPTKMPAIDSPIPSPIYITMPSSCKGRPTNHEALNHPSESVDICRDHVTTNGLLQSSPYQPPPLPPRIGSSSIHGTKVPSVPVLSSVTCSSSVNPSGPYKPVPPPKPFGGQNIHHSGTEKNQDPYPHILVTDQGQFLTHSTKFPIHEESQKLTPNDNQRTYNDIGIDNPAMIMEPDMQRLGYPNKEMSINHYAQMRNYDQQPRGPPQYHSNGQHLQAKPLQYGIQPSQLNQQTGNWQQYAGDNVYNGHQSPSKRQIQQNQPNELAQVNGIGSKSFQLSQHQQNGAIRSISFAPGTSFNDQEGPRNENMRSQATLTDVPNGCHQPLKSNSLIYVPPHTHMNGGTALFHSHTNGTSINHNHMNGSVLTNGQVNSVNMQNGPTNGSALYGRTNGGSVTSQFNNGCSHNTNAQKAEDDNAVNVNNEESEFKKDEKWGSIKKAGKTYSHFKNMFSTKGKKTDPKAIQEPKNNITMKPTNAQGQNTKDNVTESQLQSYIPEPFRNGHQRQPHPTEDIGSSFQRAPIPVQYSSLKARLDDPSVLPRTDSSMYIYPDRNQYRLSGRSNCPIPDTRNQSEALSSQRAESCSYLGVRGIETAVQLPSWSTHHRSDENLNRILPSDHTYPEIKSKPGSIPHLPSGKGGSDSGRGTGGSGNELKVHDTSLESGSSNVRMHSNTQSSGNESEWIDIPDTDTPTKLPFIKEIDRHFDGTRTPPLPPVSPETTPKVRLKYPMKEKMQSQSFSRRAGNGSNKPDILEQTERNRKTTTDNQQGSLQRSSSLIPASSTNNWIKHQISDAKEPKIKREKVTQEIASKTHLKSSSRPPIDNNRRLADRWSRPFSQYDDDDVTSTDAALDLNSMLDGATEATTDDDLASTRDDDTFLIRKQLEGLEGMYSEVLKVLGNRRPNRHGELRPLRRRLHGSMSSIPSSIMSARPVRDKKGRIVDEKLKRSSKDPPVKTTHKRFQRLESHVVTLARSVAHLSSEMRNQQLMFQEIESVRNELSALRIATRTGGAMSYQRGRNSGANNVLWNPIESGTLALTNQGRVKKLTKFFGDEPPLVQMFLKKLGYEKYSSIFEKEKIGMLELPYMTEARLQKMGIPLGPRLRILQESQGPIKTEGNLSVYVV